MRLLLDTQILVWLASDRSTLSMGEKRAIAGADEVFVSAIALMELRVKARAERRRGVAPSLMSPADAIAFCAVREILIHPLTADDLTVTLSVDPPHGDPFDEMMLVHAHALQARLLTRDRQLLRHPLAYAG